MNIKFEKKLEKPTEIRNLPPNTIVHMKHGTLLVPASPTDKVIWITSLNQFSPSQSFTLDDFNDTEYVILGTLNVS